jgi:hypothetical protein
MSLLISAVIILSELRSVKYFPGLCGCGSPNFPLTLTGTGRGPIIQINPSRVVRIMSVQEAGAFWQEFSVDESSQQME